MSLSVRSLAASLFVHAVCIAVLCVLPLSMTDRFSTEGRQHVVAIELSQARPASPDTLVTMTEMSKREVPHLLEQVRWDRAENRAIRQTERAKSSRFAPPPELPTARLEVAVAISRPPKQNAALPTIEPIVPPRPRSSRASSFAPPAIDAPHVPQTVGWSETSADFSANPPPRYPAEAARGRKEGTVMLRLQVDSLGKVTQVQIIASSGHGSLDRAAVEAVKQWKGHPARRFGQPVASEEILPVRFRL